MIFSGPAKFANNIAETYEGGVLYLFAFSEIILKPGSFLTFADNSGKCVQV